MVANWHCVTYLTTFWILVKSFPSRVLDKNPFKEEPQFNYFVHSSGIQYVLEETKKRHSASLVILGRSIIRASSHQFGTRKYDIRSELPGRVPMPFPEARRVIYAHNPLVEVLCQFRFPPNLSIETELPSAFQKSIRDQYPLYTEKLELQLKVPDGQGVAHVIAMPASAVQSIQRKNHEFLSADGQWKINLTRDFIAFSTLSYTRWEDFRNHFVGAYELFLSLYNPPFFTRIGLRYRDVIVRSKLGLENTPWTELLKPQILGVLSSSDVEERVSDVNHVTEINLKDGVSKVRIVDGLVKNVDPNEICYSIDSDFHIVQNVEVKDALEKLDYFNKRGSRLMQWCITEKLHNAMEPTLI